MRAERSEEGRAATHMDAQTSLCFALTRQLRRSTPALTPSPKGRGFTLIEVVLVLGLMSILVAVLVVGTGTHCTFYSSNLD